MANGKYIIVIMPIGITYYTNRWWFDCNWTVQQFLNDLVTVLFLDGEWKLQQNGQDLNNTHIVRDTLTAESTVDLVEV